MSEMKSTVFTIENVPLPFSRFSMRTFYPPVQNGADVFFCTSSYVQSTDIFNLLGHMRVSTRWSHKQRILYDNCYYFFECLNWWIALWLHEEVILYEVPSLKKLSYTEEAKQAFTQEAGHIAGKLVENVRSRRDTFSKFDADILPPPWDRWGLFICADIFYGEDGM